MSEDLGHVCVVPFFLNTEAFLLVCSREGLILGLSKETGWLVLKNPRSICFWS